VAKSYLCPHCHAIADVRPSPSVRWICAVCGRPRIPIELPDVVLGPRQAEALVRAGTEAAAASVWRVAAIVVAAFGAFALVLMLLVLGLVRPGVVPVVLALSANGIPFVFAVLAIRRSAVLSREAPRSLQAAWSAAAIDVLRHVGGTIDAKELARTTRITEEDANHVLARLSAEGAADGTVSDESDLRYRLLEPHRTDATETREASED
jgi:hypothetical protein